MTDPFTALRAQVTPVDPDPAFAAALRERLQRAVLAPGQSAAPERSAAPEQSEQGAAMTSTVTTAEQVRATLTPYIAVSDARRALQFYVDAFGARPRGEPYVMDDGRIGHAELALGNSVLMLADEFPDIGHTAPAPGQGGFTLHVEVPDVDATLRRALDLGATLDRPAADHEYGRNAALIDPFGHRWMVASPGAPAPAGTRHGDVAYLTHAVRDTARARAFYGAVLGWAFGPGSVEDGWQIEGTTPSAGMWGGGQAPGIEAVYFVDDLDAALDAVREHGGSADTPVDRHYGRMAECTDDQGTRFSLLQS